MIFIEKTTINHMHCPDPKYSDHFIVLVQITGVTNRFQIDGFFFAFDKCDLGKVCRRAWEIN